MYKYKGSTCIIVAIILCGAFIYKMQVNKFESFKTYSDYGNDNKKTMLLSDIYNTAEHPSITANNYSDIYQSYPVFLANSKNNNNIKNWKRPTNGKCSRAEFCGNVYSDTDQQISPEPRPPPLNKPRVNFYEASSSLCE
tara:strand:- start:969 stop:1385 length:417 start_codon:yes stop_codon:yes gene_type:complete